MSRIVAFAIAFVLAGLGAASPATAGGWPLPDAGEVLLAFGASYGEANRTHSGLDIAAHPGSAVLSPFDAVVSFAGRVPASGGGTSVCVSLDLGDGRIMTLLPLSESGLQAGQPVFAGDAIGVLAARGDISSDSPHLHVGLRRGSVYLDPAGVLSPPHVPEPGTPMIGEPAPAGGPPPLPPAPAAGGAAPVPAGSAVPAGTVAAEVPVSAPGIQVEPGTVPARGTPSETIEQAEITAADVFGAQAPRGDTGMDASLRPAEPTVLKEESRAPATYRMATEAALDGVSAPGGIRRTGRFWAIAALLFAAAVLLWPLWSTYAPHGLSESVTPVGDDIAAAVDR